MSYNNDLARKGGAAAAKILGTEVMETERGELTAAMVRFCHHLFWLGLSHLSLFWSFLVSVHVARCHRACFRERRSTFVYPS